MVIIPPLQGGKEGGFWLFDSPHLTLFVNNPTNRWRVSASVAACSSQLLALSSYIVACSSQTVACSSQAVACRLQLVSCSSQTVACSSWTVACSLQLVDCSLQLVDCSLQTVACSQVALSMNPNSFSLTGLNANVCSVYQFKSRAEEAHGNVLFGSTVR